MGAGAACAVCLGASRRRAALRDPALQLTYRRLLQNSDTRIDLAVCWECTSLLRKATVLRTQIEKVTEALIVTAADVINEVDYDQFGLKSNLGLSPVKVCDNCTPIESLEYDKIKFEEVDTHFYDIDSSFDDSSMTDPKVEFKHAEDTEDDKEGLKIAKNQHKYGKKKCQMSSKKIKDTRKQKDENTLKKSLRNAKAVLPTRIQDKKKTNDSKMFTVIKLSDTEIAMERLRESQKESYLKFRYKCENCIVGFDFEEKYNDHLAKKHNKDVGEHHCAVCNTFLSCPRTLSNHRMRHRRRFQCRLCDRRTIDKEVIVKHYATVHEHTVQRYSCEKCGKISTSIRSHRYHVQAHAERPQCHHCGRIFTCKNNLRCHLLRHDGAGAGSFRCEKCGKQYRGKSGLAAHMIAVHSAPGEARRYYCAACDAHYQTSSSYGQHLRTSNKHVPVHKRRFACGECDQRFATENLLRKHSRLVHLQKEPHKCAHCNKNLSSPWHLSRHIKFVHDRAPRPRDFICHVCGQSFTSASILKSHIRCHTGERPLCCSDCNATFAQRSALYTHHKLVHAHARGQKIGGQNAREEEGQ